MRGVMGWCLDGAYRAVVTGSGSVMGVGHFDTKARHEEARH
jgi:hypothetical protein